MFLLILFILFFYHWLLVSFNEKYEKPKNIPNKYVDLEGNLYEKNIVIGQTKDLFDYDTQAVLPPFDYDIQLNNNWLLFSSRKKEWNIPIHDEYHWTGDQIMEKDDCFGQVGNIKAKGIKLFEYIRDHEFKSTNTQSTSDRIYQNLNIYYFECEDNKIKNLHKCMQGSVFDGSHCKSIDVCDDQVNGYKYADLSGKNKYFECQQGVSISKTCPPKEIFQHDQCKKPDNICEVESDGYIVQLSKTTYGECVRGKMYTRSCNPDYYFLNGKCEMEVCFEKDNEIVAVKEETKTGPFSFQQYFGTCVKGKLTQIKSCPLSWDYSKTDVDILELPQVFDKNKCVAPKLCENVKLINKAVIPAYLYAKHLATWDKAVYFDRTIGYKCNDSQLESVHVPHGSLVKHFKVRKACDELKNIPTNEPNKYYNCATDKTVTCPIDNFFDGTTCLPKNPKAFRFNNHLDVFQFNHLSETNNWMQPRSRIHKYDKPTCSLNEVYIPSMNMCTHKECEPFLFIRELHRPILLNEKNQCNWNGTKIVKEKFQNPKGLRLKFWKQQLVRDESIDFCEIGQKIETGNFVLDSTLYATCDTNQPFVFCPSNFTEKIEKVGTHFACLPNDKVYEYKLKKLKNVELYRFAINKILIPKNTTYILDGQNFKTDSYTELSIPPDKNITFKFGANEDTKILYKSLVNNPPNTYILNRQLEVCHTPGAHFDITEGAESFWFLRYKNYDLKYKITDFKY